MEIRELQDKKPAYLENLNDAFPEKLLHGGASGAFSLSLPGASATRSPAQMISSRFRRKLKNLLPFATVLPLALCGCKGKSNNVMNEPEPDAKPAETELHVIRFMGPEIYRISSAEWNLYRDEEDGGMNLWISVECDRAIKQFEDTSYTDTILWELNLIGEEITAEEGFEGMIPEGYDKSRERWLTGFFYEGSQEGSDRNTIKILKRDGDRLLIRLTGEAIDPNFYDDSKPRAQLLAETWFTRNAQGSRSR